MNINKKNNNLQCRTCFQATKGLKLLSKLATDQKQSPKSFADLLMEVTNINIMDNVSKGLTQFICGCCCRKLKAAYAFVQQAHKVNEKFLAILDHEECKILDCVPESQVDISSCLEIKVENDDVEVKAGQEECLLQVKLEDLETSILNNNINMDTINTKRNETEMVTLNEGNNSNISNDNISLTDNNDKTNVDVDISDYEYDNEDYLSKDSEGQLKIKSCTNKNKPDPVTDDVDEDIAVPCNQCNKIFNNSKELARHQRNSHIPEEEKCSCPLCGHKFTRSCSMYKHMRTFHGPDTVPLIRKPSTQERPYQCDKCSRNYVKQKHLNFHMRTKHSNENDIVNNEKDKLTDGSLSDGKNPKRYEQPSLCSVCGSSFTSKAFLIVHMRRHTGERPFKCDLCDRAYPRKMELTVHRRLHTGEKPFECKLCGKAFRVSGKLATHMRSHTDIRPYKCKQCERSFKYSKDLSIHFRIHTGERPYCCNVCGSTFTQSNSLKAHRTKLGHMENSAV